MRVTYQKTVKISKIFSFISVRKQKGKPDVMILAQEATRIEVPNDPANVVDLVQGRRYEIYPGTPRIYPS